MTDHYGRVLVWRFVAERTVPGGATRTGVLYDAFRYWLDYNARYGECLSDSGMTAQKFAETLTELGYPSRKTRGVMVRDLALADDDIDYHDGAIAVQTYFGTGTQPVTTFKPSGGGHAVGYGSEFPWGNDAGEKLDMIVREYSNHGNGRTVREVAEMFGTSEDDVRETLKSANVRKSDPPFAPDRLLDEDVDDLVDEGIEVRRHAYKVKAERAERRDMAKRLADAEAAVADHDARREHIRNGVAAGLREVSPHVQTDPAYSPDGWAAHFPIADPHVGLQVYGKESWTGENYHTDIAADRVVESARRAAGWVDGMSGMLGLPRVIHYSILGDLFHALHYATVSGRPMQVDGRQRRVFEKVVNSVASAIVTMAQVAPIQARLADGNHDGDLVFYAATALAAYFKDDPNISVTTSYNHQCSFLEGETLHILDHGRTWGNLDTPKVGRDAANLMSELGAQYPPHRHAKIWVGDKHSPSLAWPGRHVEVMRMPALASLDDYAQGLNYSHDFDAYCYALGADGRIAHQGRLYEAA